MKDAGGVQKDASVVSFEHPLAMLLHDPAPTSRAVRAGVSVTLLLGVLLCAVAYEAWYLGVSVDEPSHLVSAHLYWHGRDRLPPRDMPPLIKIVGGWPSALMGLPLAEDLGKPGDQRAEWTEGAMLMRNLPGEQLRDVMFWSRLPLVIFPLAITLLLWLWARELFGEAAALAIAALWVFSPTPLAHSAFLKNDLAATCTYLLFWYAAWRFWPQPSPGRAMALALCTALAVMSKLSMLFLLGMAPLVVLLRPGRLRNLGALVAVVYLVLAAGYQFEMHRTTTEELEALAKDPRVPSIFVAAAQAVRWIPIPEGLWTGVFTLSQSNFGDVPVYLMGQVFTRGHPAYFVIAMLLKFPWPSLLLLVCGVGVLVFRWRWIEGRDAFWIVPGLLYFALASQSALQHGVRLVLPASPFFLLIAGVFLVRLRRLMLVPVLLQVGMTALNFPNGVAHFNAYAGPPSNACRLLNDSNIDWGQALPDVGHFVRENRIEKIHLSYFGFDNPARYLEPGKYELIAPPWSDQWTKTERFEPAPGWYAISASLLPGHFFAPRYRDYYAAFHNRQPVATAGGSIFIYRVE